MFMITLKLVGNGQRPSLGLMGFLWVIHCKQANCIWKVKIWTNIHRLCLINDQLAQSSMCQRHQHFVSLFWAAVCRRHIWRSGPATANSSLAKRSLPHTARRNQWRLNIHVNTGSGSASVFQENNHLFLRDKITLQSLVNMNDHKKTMVFNR